LPFGRWPRGSWCRWKKIRGAALIGLDVRIVVADDAVVALAEGGEGEGIGAGPVENEEYLAVGLEHHAQQVARPHGPFIVAIRRQAAAMASVRRPRLRDRCRRCCRWRRPDWRPGGDCDPRPGKWRRRPWLDRNRNPGPRLSFCCHGEASPRATGNGDMDKGHPSVVRIWRRRALTERRPPGVRANEVRRDSFQNKRP